MKTIALSIRDSLFSMLGRPAKPAPAADLSAIQQAMLSLLPDAAPVPERILQLRTRLLASHDVEALWYLRAEIFNHLCQSQDEALALSSLQSVEPLFVPHLPKSLTSSRAPGSGIQRHRRLSKRTSWDATQPPPGF